MARERRKVRARLMVHSGIYATYWHREMHAIGTSAYATYWQKSSRNNSRPSAPSKTRRVLFLAKAYEEALGDGMPEDAARAWALTSLGDPYSANKDYRETFLTDREAMSAPQSVNLYFGTTVYLVTVLLIVISYGVWWNWIAPRANHLVLGAFMAIVLCGYVVCVFRAYRFAKRVRQCRLAGTNPTNCGTLDSWLDVATWDLCKEAKVRVCGEVQAHFAAAHEEALCDGQSAEAAAAHALHALGDAVEANKQLQALYFTKSELATVIGRMKPTGRAYNWFFIVIITLGSIVFIDMKFRFGLKTIRDELFQFSNFIMQLAMAVFFTLNRRFPRFALAAQLIGLSAPALLLNIVLFSWCSEKFLGTTGVTWQAFIVGVLVGAPLPYLALPRIFLLIKKLNYEFNRQAAGL